MPRRLVLAAVIATLPIAAQAEGQLSIYNWFDYMPQELIDKFTAETGIEVIYDTYDSNETMLARLKAGVTGYDVAMPGDYMVAIMIQEGMLAQIDAQTMPNGKNIDPQWVDVYWDPGRLYSIPYQWGTTSFSVDTAVYGGDVDSLALVFDPPAQLQGRINVLRDVNDVLNMGLRYLDLPRCNDDPAQLRALNDLLVAAKPHWISFNSDGAKEVLVSGDASVGMIWNGYGMRAREEKPSLTYAYPKQGFTAWMDNIVVLQGAPNLENAKTFVNFMMLPENAAMVSNYARYANGLLGTEAFLDPDLIAAPEFVPPSDAPAPEFVPPCSPDVVRLYDRIWTNLLR